MPAEASSISSSRLSLGVVGHRRPKRRRSPTGISSYSVGKGPSQELSSTVKVFKKRSTNDEGKRVRNSFTRRWLTNENPLAPDSEGRFLIVSYNVLGDDNVQKHMDLYSTIPPQFLKWDRRLNLICDELSAWEPAIVCLQEVDRFDDLMGTLSGKGFVGSFKRRTGVAMDGCAVFWKENMFHMLEEENIEFRGFGLRDNVAQLFVFEMKKSKTRRLVIGNIHVLFNPNRGDIKLGQLRLLLQKANALSQKWGNVPVLLCGDFNTTPGSAIYDFLTSPQIYLPAYNRRCLSGQMDSKPRKPYIRVDRSSKHEWTEEELINASGNSKCKILENPLRLYSSYASVKGMRTRDAHGEPLATSYHSSFFGTVDYQWHSDGLLPIRVLDTFPANILRETGGIPSKKFGSDHLALVSEFAFTQQKPNPKKRTKPKVDS